MFSWVRFGSEYISMELTWSPCRTDQSRPQASPCGKRHRRAGLAFVLEQGRRPRSRPQWITDARMTEHLFHLLQRFSLQDSCKTVPQNIPF